MKTAIGVGAPDSGKSGSFDRVVDFVVEAEKLGVEVAWSAEAWGMDALTPLAFIAARTSKIKLGTGIAQVSARAPGNLAMSAMSLALLSNNRFILGLGASGPQVVEGLHGVPFRRPLTRMRELIDILRLAFNGEKLVYAGSHYRLPLPEGEGKPLKLAMPANPDIPIYMATLAPRSLELTGEIADGWIGTSFTPATARTYLDPIEKGARKAGRKLNDIALSVPAVVGISDDVERLVEKRRPALAFQLGAMGSARTNFYNDAFRRLGYEEVARKVQQLWVAGKRDEAIKAVPDDLVMENSILGTQDMVKERLRAFAGAGIDLLQLQVIGRNLDAKLAVIDTVHRLIEENEKGG